MGNTSNVSTVDETIPPMTTVASVRCTSAPVPLLRAMGTKPRLATRAVINTGRKRVMAPSTTASNRSPVRCYSSRMNATMTRPFNTAMPDRAMKPTAAEIDSGMPRSHSDSTPPVSAGEGDQRVTHRTQRHRQHADDDCQRHRHDNGQPAADWRRPARPWTRKSKSNSCGSERDCATCRPSRQSSST